MAKKLKAVGFHLLIEVDKVEEVSKGGIVLIEDTLEREKRAKMTGTVVDIGELCWLGEDMEIPCQVGDRIYHVQYSGANIEHDDGKEYRFINDKDVLGVVIDE